MNKPTLTRRGIGPYLRISSFVSCALHVQPLSQELETSPFSCVRIFGLHLQPLFKMVHHFSRACILFLHSVVDICRCVVKFECLSLNHFIFPMQSFGWVEGPPASNAFRTVLLPPQRLRLFPNPCGGICGEETCVSQDLMDVHHLNMCFDLSTKTFDRFPHACS